ncbi:hypothetical protein DFH11DRAFT_1728569 [Phellopilus nigrolimitatus]|nr:hypothetical protein DFH11DRAFT_1728569 [Phellopilus nigrolimitatus]
MSGIDDPRATHLEARLTLPKTWTTGGAGESLSLSSPRSLTDRALTRAPADGFSASSMLLAGVVMVTHNRFLAWPALLIGISAFFNQHPLRTKDGGSSWQGLISGISALVMSYMPMVLVARPAGAPEQAPLSP